MRLCLLIDRRYAPYSKWLGTAFSQLEVAATLGPTLGAVMSAEAFPEREEALVEAFRIVARHHNESAVAGWVDPEVSQFYGRPYRVLSSGRFVDACLQYVKDPWLRGLPLVGGVDQFVDSTDVLSYGERARRLARLTFPGGEAP
jgi:hypothetical protein